jgi:EpsI family protein
MPPSSVSRRSIVMAALMGGTAAAAYALRPGRHPVERGAQIDLEKLIPSQFGPWRQEAQAVAQVINPQTKELLDKLYNQILNRTYVAGADRRVMLSLAYGGDQRGSLEAHKPEVCYPAQGFRLLDERDGALATPFGSIPVRRLNTSMGPRVEPLTYWFTMGETLVQSRWDKRLVELRLALTGQIPDGLLFRVSSIDRDPERAWRVQQEFVTDLLGALGPAERARLTGLGPV